MSAKKSFVLRIDESVYQALEKWAADEFRSVNGQIEWIVHQQLRAAGRIKPGGGAQQDNTARPSKKS